MTDRVGGILAAIEAILGDSPTARELKDLCGVMAGCQMEAQARFLSILAEARHPQTAGLLTPEQAAKVLNVKKRWVYRYHSRLNGCVVRPSPGLLRFDEAALRNWINNGGKT